MQILSSDSETSQYTWNLHGIWIHKVSAQVWQSVKEYYFYTNLAL